MHWKDVTKPYFTYYGMAYSILKNIVCNYTHTSIRTNCSCKYSGQAFWHFACFNASRQSHRIICLQKRPKSLLQKLVSSLFMPTHTACDIHVKVLGNKEPSSLNLPLCRAVQSIMLQLTDRHGPVAVHSLTALSCGTSVDNLNSACPYMKVK